MTSNVIKINGKCIRIYNLSRKALYKKYLSNNWIHETDEIDIEEIDIPKKSVSDPKALDQFLAQIGIDISNKQKKSSPPVPSKSEQEKTEDQPVASESVENIIDNFITKLNTLISPLAKLEQEPEEWLDKHKYDYIKPWYKNSRDEMIDELYSTAKEYWVKYIDEDDPYNWDILLAELEEFDKIPYRDNLYLVKFGDAINKLKKWIKYNDNVDRQIKCLEFANYLKRYNENKETVFVEPPSCYKVAKLQPQIIECHSQINERECMEANGKEYESDYNDGLSDDGLFGKQVQILLPYENWKQGCWTTNEDDANLFFLLDYYDESQMPDNIGDPECIEKPEYIKDYINLAQDDPIPIGCIEKIERLAQSIAINVVGDHTSLLKSSNPPQYLNDTFSTSSR
ncbi:hypothetical protein GLOIN_2v1875323 [Rhizophagus clarus]|uniref:Uncharacterized protein n=1 Tax=Rhizophagus clarus TaxID=94130 RepID=A0A8H3QT71_9GLOM|nr:hypothetical protein GLOIN_2v1875323 [Rhizophagus clarus]